MSVSKVNPRRKIKKKKTLAPKRQSQKKQDLDQNINDSKSYIWSSFFENIIWGIQLYKKSITRSLIIFKKSRKMKKNWTSSEFSL